MFKKLVLTTKINGSTTNDVINIQNCLPAGFPKLKIEIENSNMAE